MKTHFHTTNRAVLAACPDYYTWSKQTACGYMRELVTSNPNDVDCLYCLRSEQMKGLVEAKKASTYRKLLK